MEIIALDEHNIASEHICCAISDKKDENCVGSKKAWLKERFNDGLVFKKANVRGKVFIEYVPGENAWFPIEADGYMFVNCLWVSGQYKGRGLSNALFEECVIDSRKAGKKGLVAIAATKKMPFLHDPKFLKHKGFKVVDSATPYFELWCLKFDEGAVNPKIKACAKEGLSDLADGVALYYSNQCPHTEKYAPLLQEAANAHNVKFKLIKVDTLEKAKNSPALWTTYSLFFNGRFVTNEILTEKKFLDLIDKG